DIKGSFRSGQSFGVLAPGEDETGRVHKVRLYAIASPTGGETGDGTIMATTVKRTVYESQESGALVLGVTSNYLCDLAVGDEVRITGPNGKRFLLPSDTDSHDFVFIATGTGIAPFRGMIGELLARGSDSRVTLIMGASYTTDLLYDDEFLRLSDEHERFAYTTAISRERNEDTDSRMYAHDRLSLEWDSLRGSFESGRALLYVCGIAGMELSIFQVLARLMDASTLDEYLRVEAEVASDIDTWDRRMIHKQVKPTRRVFLEVY
ncbi:MAG: ferredoxin reductase domain-containing protein, partial [Planctomycetota bacterium]